MWQTICLFVAVFLLLSGITNLIDKVIETIIYKRPVKVAPYVLVAALGLTYILWYAN